MEYCGKANAGNSGANNGNYNIHAFYPYLFLIQQIGPFFLCMYKLTK